VARPSGDAWLPLGLNTDPVPGDPERISQEAANLASIAQTLSGQIAALQRIANSNENIGKTADKLRSAASTLASDLAPVEARYKTVSSALNGWYPELESAQRLSLRALDEAEGPYAKLKNIPVPDVPGFAMGLNGQYQLDPFARPTSAQQTEIANYQTAMSSAQQQLQAAQRLLQQAVNQRDTEASHYASVINNASNDSLTDSWWDKFSNWVSEHADILKEIATILQYVAIGLAVLCLLIPGVDLLILAALAVTAMMLVVHTMLAATGNGNWLDVGLDILGLVTLGMGLGATEGVEALGDSATEAATEAWESGAKDLLEEYKPALNLFRSFTDEDGALTKIGQLGVKNTLAKIAELVGEKPEAAEDPVSFLQKTAAQFKENWNTWGSLDKIAATFTHGGDPEIAKQMVKLTQLAKEFPTAEKVTDALAAGTKSVEWANVAFASGNVGAIGDFALSNAPGLDYEGWKDDNFSYTLSTAQANALADVPGDVMFQGFRVASSFMGS
jgi:Putative T7SS secretion signal domain